eukprot:3031502-Pleurochrysis_carterae.AAC.1
MSRSTRTHASIHRESTHARMHARTRSQRRAVDGNTRISSERSHQNDVRRCEGACTPMLRRSIARTYACMLAVVYACGAARRS